MPEQKDNRITFRAKPLTLRMLEDRAELGRSSEAVARFLLEACLNTLPDSLPTFSEDEALFICAFLGRTSIHPDALHFLRRDMVEELKESKRNSFDVSQLRARLESLTPFEWVAVVDASQRYWRGEYRKDAETSAKRLREVGLVGD